MILRCVGGPMDGAQYALSRETVAPSQRSTNRKPDALVFDRLGGETDAMYRQGKVVLPDDDGYDVVIEYNYVPTVMPATCNRGYECGAKT